jgi:hypothetical protein
MGDLFLELRSTNMQLCSPAGLPRRLPQISATALPLRPNDHGIREKLVQQDTLAFPLSLAVALEVTGVPGLAPFIAPFCATSHVLLWSRRHGNENDRRNRRIFSPSTHFCDIKFIFRGRRSSQRHPIYRWPFAICNCT